MKERRYAIYDVFTATPFAGNPLAVIFDGGGLSDEAMQAVAGEFNLSETIFVTGEPQPGHFEVRIFTPGQELPFAGHPTVGAAIALAEDGQLQGDRATGQMLVLQEKAGPVRCIVRTQEKGASFAEFDIPKLPQQGVIRAPEDLDTDRIAAAFGVGSHDIGFENHVPALWSAGVPYVTIPVRDLSVAQKLRFNREAWAAMAPSFRDAPSDAYVYCRDCVQHDATIHARMFSQEPAIFEDPATGSAAAALSGALADFDALQTGHHAHIIEQGMEMGRPSTIHLHIEIEEGVMAKVRIGGHAVRVAEGMLSA